MTKKKVILFIFIIIFIIIGSLVFLKGGSQKMQGFNQKQESIDKLLKDLSPKLGSRKEQVKFDEWAGKVSGDEMRFHMNVSLPDSIFSPYQIVREENGTWFFAKPNKREPEFFIEICQFNSVRETHEAIVLYWENATIPVISNQRPKGCNFGDVYIEGTWSRDNLMIVPNNIETPELENAICNKLDSFLTARLTLSPPEDKMELQITKFYVEPKSIKIGEKARLIIESSIDILKAQVKIFAKGGKIERIGDELFYCAEEIGEHRLECYLTDKKNHTIKAETVVFVD